LLAQCIDAAGCHKAGALLYRLNYWRKYNEDGWVARTNADWKREAHLTEKELRTAKNKLVRKGLILTRTGKLNGRVVFEMLPVPTGAMIPCPPGHPNHAPVGGVYIIQENMKDIIGGRPKQDATPEPGKISGKGKKAGEVLHAVGTKPKQEPSDNLWLTWRAAWLDTYGPPAVAWSGMEIGKARHLVNKVGDVLAASVVDAAVRHWPEMALHLKETTTAYKLPSYPDLGLVLKFAQSAVEFTRRTPKEEAPASNTGMQKLSDL
jgi:hypothetical protein